MKGPRIFPCNSPGKVWEQHFYLIHSCYKLDLQRFMLWFREPLCLEVTITSNFPSSPLQCLRWHIYWVQNSTVQARRGTQTPAGVWLIELVLFCQMCTFLLIKSEGSFGGKGNGVNKSFPASGTHVAPAPSSSLAEFLSLPCLGIERQIVLGGGLRTMKEARVCSVMNFYYCQMLKPAWAWPLNIIRRDLSRPAHRVIGTRVQVLCCHCKKKFGKGSKRLQKQFSEVGQTYLRD